MRQLVIVVLLLLSATEALAQNQDNREEVRRRGHFGAPAVKWTIIRDQGTLMFGGRGGWNITPSLLLGGSLYGTMTEVDARHGAVPDAPGPLDIKFETFGFDLEYAVRPKAPTHLTLGVLLGGAAAHYVRNKTHEQHGETDFMFLLEPLAGVEQRVTDRIHLNLAGSYRLVSGVEQQGLKDADCSGPAAALAVKFGRF
jgi:hypothetical protein